MSTGKKRFRLQVSAAMLGVALMTPSAGHTEEAAKKPQAIDPTDKLIPPQDKPAYEVNQATIDLFKKMGRAARPPATPRVSDPYKYEEFTYEYVGKLEAVVDGRIIVSMPIDPDGEQQLLGSGATLVKSLSEVHDNTILDHKLMRVFGAASEDFDEKLLSALIGSEVKVDMKRTANMAHVFTQVWKKR